MTNDAVRAWGPDIFCLKLADGRSLKASEFRPAGKATRSKLKRASNAVRRSLRCPGWEAVVAFVSSDGGIRVEWRAILRDGSNYVRQQLTVRPTQTPLALSEVSFLQLEAPRARGMGVVDGSPVVDRTLFFACENPMARNRVAQGRVSCSVPVYGVLKPGESWTGTSVIGAVPRDQLRRAFLYYVERERPRPYKPFLHYNSWYDIAWKDRKMSEGQCLERIEAFGHCLFKQRATKLDAFVFDDGWDDNKTLWRFHEGFPHGFKPLVSAASRYGSALGAWLSPWGGYSRARDERLKYGATQGFETNRRGFSLAGPKYYGRFRDVCVEMMRDHGVRFFKFDGVGVGSSPTGAGSEYGPDIQALFRLLSDLRSSCPEVFLNVTAGTWPSPFWLWHSDAVWRGGRDAAHLGSGSMRQRWLTYRDAIAYQRAVLQAPLFPLNSLKSQGLCLGQLGRDYAKLAVDPKDVIDEIRMMFVSGTQQQDLFVTPTLMTPEMWDALAEAANWCRRNADVLVDTHWVGGDPAKGQVYGYASWSRRKGILGLRNPSDAVQALELSLQTAFGLPPGAPRRYVLRSPWKRGSPKLSLTLEAGRRHRFTLAPFEVLVLDAVPVGDK